VLEFSDVAVAPIQPAVRRFFFFTSAILAVMTNRLGRIIGAMVDFLSRPGVVPARNLCGHGEPAHRRSLNRSALNIWGLRPFAIRNLYRVFNVVRKLA
jgi:hypothetical protein